MIPDFDQNGNLPPGLYETTWDELSERYGHTGHRRFLLKGLKRMIWDLRKAGCKRIYIDGSFITNKEVVFHEPPRDFDCLWGYEGGFDGTKLLPPLDHWDPPRDEQKKKYRGECLPATPHMLNYFQRKNRHDKGILFIDIEAMP